jgi:AraC-like DNA-binding protein/ligand-binding sensor domain-containing protein
MKGISIIIRSIMVGMMMNAVMHTTAQTTVTYDNRSGLSHWIVSDVLQDRLGFLWFATWNGLNRYDGYEFRQVKAMPGDGTSIQSDVIRRIVLDDDGNIICRTEAGNYCFNLKTYIMQDVAQGRRYPLLMQSRPHEFRDAEGNTWSIRRYGIDKTTMPHHPASLVEGTENVQARAFMRDGKQRWWLATKEDESLRLYDSHNRLIGYLGADGRLHQQPTPFGYRAYCIMTSSSGDVWIGCKPGALLRLSERPDGSFLIRRITHPQLTCDIVYHIAEDSNRRLWLATFGDGIMCIPNPEAQQPECISFIGNGTFSRGKSRARRLLITRNGNIVCATTNGLVIGTINQSHISQSTFRRILRDGKRAESLAGNSIMDVAQRKDGRLFIALEDNGIDAISEQALFSPHASFTHYNSHNSSLSSDACLSITENEHGNFFIVCTDRVLDFNPDNDATVTYSRQFWSNQCHFSEERPLQLFSKAWVFGQEQGAYIATQHNLYTRGYTPPLVFTQLHIRGRQPMLGVCNADTLTLATDERNFSISFAALDFTDNSGISYRNRIDGGEWNNMQGERSITFYNIRPGTITLEVQSTDRYGRWTDNNRRLVIIALPHWYETAWATLLGWLLIIGIVTGVVYTIFHIRELHRQRRELLQKYMAVLAQADSETTHPATEECTDPQTSVLHAQLPSELSDSDKWFLDRVRQYINANIANSNANIDDMAAEAATSRSNLNRKLRSLVGITATQLLIDARMQRARNMLRSVSESDSRNIADIAYSCGYTDPRYFSRCFKQRYGVTPSEYKV